MAITGAGNHDQELGLGLGEKWFSKESRLPVTSEEGVSAEQQKIAGPHSDLKIRCGVSQSQNLNDGPKAFV